MTTPQLPFLTADLPGIGGQIKLRHEEFVVEEIPTYKPSGQGTHVYFGIEKNGLTTPAAIGLIAKALGKQRRDIGYAGLKDARAVTRQTLSIEHVDSDRVVSLAFPGLKILWAKRHGNKLKLGHLQGNRFIIRIRDVEAEKEEQVRSIVEILSQRGVPNYYGPQRFGMRQDNAEIGLAILNNDHDEAMAIMLGRFRDADAADDRQARDLFDANDYAASAEVRPGRFGHEVRACRVMAKSDGDARKAWRSVDHTLRKLILSAAQSELFNRVLTARLDRIGQLSAGDVAVKHVNGACFLVEDAAVELPRCDAFELSPTGPIFGTRMKEAGGTQHDLECKILAEAGLQLGNFKLDEKFSLKGSRRPLRVPLADPNVESGSDEFGTFVELSFSLPAGSYATAVTREITKDT